MLKRRKWSKAKVIAEIRLRKRQGKSLSGSTVSRKDGVLYQKAHKYFGHYGWRHALRVAGYSPCNVFRRKPFWTKTKFKTVLGYLHRANIPLHEQFLRKNGLRFVFEAGRYLYGTWEKAIQSIGIKYENVRQRKPLGYWKNHPKRVIREIRRLKKNGVPLNHNFIQYARGDLFAAAYLHYGKWGDAVEVAGFSYPTECKHFPTQRWIDSLTKEKFENMQNNATRFAKKRREYVKSKKNGVS